MPKATRDGMKVCSLCRANLPIAEYTRDRARSDGLSYRCRNCVAITTAEHSEKNVARVARWRENNPGARQSWELNARERTRSRERERYAENPERKQRNTRKWREANPGKHNAIQRARRARQRSLPAEKYDILEIVSRDGARCALTGIELDVTDRSRAEVDHLVPLKVDMEVYGSCLPRASHHPGDVLSAVRLAYKPANAGRGNRYSLLDHCQLQHMMPELFPEVDYSKYEDLDESLVPAG